MAEKVVRSEHLGTIPNLERTFPKEFSLELFRRANFSHQFEKKVAQAWDKKLFAIPIYLSLGTEFNAAALSLVCKDWRIFGQHRAHSIYLSFGGKPEALRDELLGLSTGCSGGMSGSNAIQGREIKMFGHSGLMGEQVPIACGSAYASRQPVLTICGDASVEEDYIYPSLGWAATEKLPIIFICEDNDLSILTKVEARRNWSPVEVAKGMGIQAVDITDDPWLIAHHVREMSKNLPGFINIRSVRVLWHSGTGIDGAPEWDRYKITTDKIAALGLKSEMDKIESENTAKVNGIWNKVLGDN